MSSPAHVEVFYRIKDAKDKTGVTQHNFPITVDIAVLQTYLESTGVLIDAVIRGQIVAAGISLILSVDDWGMKSAPLANSDNEEGAFFGFGVDGGGSTGFRLPTFDEALLLAGTNLVDVAAPAVSALVARILEGQTVALVNVSPSNIYGSDITEITSAVESFLSS